MEAGKHQKVNGIFTFFIAAESRSRSLYISAAHCKPISGRQWIRTWNSPQSTLLDAKWPIGQHQTRKAIRMTLTSINCSRRVSVSMYVCLLLIDSTNIRAIQQQNKKKRELF